MKNEKELFLALTIFLCVPILFVSCAKKTTAIASPADVPLAVESTSVAQQNIDVLEQKAAEQSYTSIDEKSSSNKVDVDLTKMSSTMVYAEVFNMLIEPESYIGKTVKMNGDFFVYKPMLADGTESDRNFYACVIADATACCVQGLEFALKESKKYPEEYPELGSQITVVGMFEIYEEMGVYGIRIKDAMLI